MTKVYCSSEPTCSNNSFEEKLAGIISEFSFVELRARQIQDADLERLNNLHERISTLCLNDFDEHRRIRHLKLLPASNCIREKILLLKKHQTEPAEETFYASYTSAINEALTRIVEDSFEDEFRKIEINLGLVDAIAELFIIEVDVFGYETPMHPNARPIRKAIGNALTNLTYGNMRCKRHLCEYPKFLETAVNIIYHVPNLAQVYSALIRNLSWLADSAMGEILASGVPALTKAAIRSSQQSDEKCLLASLSALWNLASHSQENKRVMCETPEFLRLLISLLSSDLRHISLIESASGIIKYISAYIVQKSELIKKVHEMKIIRSLLKLLQSSSFTVLANSLGALNQFANWDSITQKKLLQDPPAMAFLNGLRNSTREDIRTSAKSVLNHLHSVNYTPQYAFTLPPGSRFQNPDNMNEASILTYDTSSLYRRNRNERLLTQRQPFYPNMHFPQLNDLKSPTFSTQSTSLATTTDTTFKPSSSMPQSNMIIHEVKSQQIYHTTASYSINAIPNEFSHPATDGSTAAVKFRSSSLPRYNILSPAKSILIEQSEQPMKRNDENHFGHKVGESNEAGFESEFIVEPLIEAENEVSDSMLCTRSASVQSLTSVEMHNASGWESRVSTVENSNNISPGSCSDLPASPSECMGFARSAEVSRSKLESPNLSMEEPKDDEAFYATYESNTNEIDEALLSNVIASVLPKPSSPRNTDSSSSTLKRDKRDLSASNTNKSSNYDEENDKFLLESIASVLPSPHKEAQGSQKLVSVKPSLIMKSIHNGGGFSPRSVSSSNKKFDQDGTLFSRTTLDRYKNQLNENGQQRESHNATGGETSGSLITSSKEKSLNEDHYNRSSGSSGSTVDGVLPEDVDFELQAELLLIDCRKVNKSADNSLTTAVTPKRKIPELKERHSRSRLCPPKNFEKSKSSSLPKNSQPIKEPTNTTTTSSSSLKRSPFQNKIREKPIVPPKPPVTPSNRTVPLKKTAQVSPLNYKRPNEMSNSSETSDIQTSNSSSKEKNDKKIGKMLVSAV